MAVLFRNVVLNARVASLGSRARPRAASTPCGSTATSSSYTAARCDSGPLRAPAWAGRGGLIGTLLQGAGGSGRSSVLQDTWSYDLFTTVWKQAPPAPPAPFVLLGAEPRRAVSPGSTGRRTPSQSRRASPSLRSTTPPLSPMVAHANLLVPSHPRPRLALSAGACARHAQAGLERAGAPSGGLFSFNNRFGWSAVLPAGQRPKARAGHFSMLDSNTNQLVVSFGATTGPTLLGDSWILDLETNKWTCLHGADAICLGPSVLPPRGPGPLAFMSGVSVGTYKAPPRPSPSPVLLSAF